MKAWGGRIVFCLIVFCLCAGGCERSPLGDDLRDARRAIANRDWANAEKYLERYLRTEDNPKLRWEAWKELLDVADHGNLGTDWSVDYLETMLAEYEEQPDRAREILRRLAEAHERSRRYDRSIQYWSMLIEEPGLDPEQSVEVHRRLAALDFRLRRFDAAEDVLQSCLALPVSEAKQAECLFDLAEQASARDLLDEGDRLARQVLDMETASPECKGRAAYIVADIQEQRGQLAEALKTFESIGDAYPNTLVIEHRIISLKKRLKSK